MTKAQKRKHVEALKAIVENSGFKLDRYDNYKNDTGAYRIKFKKINFRFEHKHGKTWFKIVSIPIVKITEDGLTKVLSGYSKKLCEIL